MSTSSAHRAPGLFVEGVTVLDPATHRTYVRDAQGKPDDHPWPGGHAFNADLSSWTGSLTLTELCEGEHEPPCWTVGQFGQYGCVLEEWRSGAMDWAADVVLVPYHADGLDAFLRELKAKTGVRFHASLGIDTEVLVMGLHPLSALDTEALYDYLDDEVTGSAETASPGDVDVPEEWMERILLYRGPGADDDDRTLVQQVVRALVWGRAHAQRLACETGAVATVDQPQVDIPRPQAAESPFDPLDLFDVLDYGLAEECALGDLPETRDLSHIDLAGQQVGSLSFSGCDLRGASFAGGDLRQNWFADADLRGAVFDRATLNGAAFDDARIAGASFCDAVFEEVTAFSPKWQGCAAHPPCFRGVSLAGVDLSDQHLDGADFAGAHLAGATFSGASLAGAAFVGADLALADLTGTSLVGADLADANLTSADLSEADLRKADLRSTKLDQANMTRADLRGAQLDCATIEQAQSLAGIRIDRTTECAEATRERLLHASALVPWRKTRAKASTDRFRGVPEMLQ